MSKCFWKSITDRLVGHRVVTDLQFGGEKNQPVSVNHNKVMCNKTRYAYMNKNRRTLKSREKKADWVGTSKP